MLTFGEVHTGLLQNSTPLRRDATVDVLNLFVGEQVRWSERPMSYAVSVTSTSRRLPPKATRRTLVFRRQKR